MLLIMMDDDGQMEGSFYGNDCKMRFLRLIPLCYWVVFVCVCVFALLLVLVLGGW